jgi:hypothetical protein
MIRALKVLVTTITLANLEGKKPNSESAVDLYFTIEYRRQ